MENERHKINVLFVCVHNSGRSRMAEKFLNIMAGDRFHAESAGLEPRPANPVVADVMSEIGLDVTQTPSNSVFDFYKQGKMYDYVITVCADTESKCPIFPGVRKRLAWPFEDPASVSGDAHEKRRRVADIRDQIKGRVERWIQEI